MVLTDEELRAAFGCGAVYTKEAAGLRAVEAAVVERLIAECESKEAEFKQRGMLDYYYDWNWRADWLRSKVKA